ncbi:MAG: class I SAM-dependent methyltransferase, partial [Planctomycetia bacterium]|nr:class I SAM-dependent methyltransferase [Planctomycetia bacterium]
MSESLFRYRCPCGISDPLNISNGTASCKHCKNKYAVSENGVLLFNQVESNQNAYFDEIYKAGHLHIADRYAEKVGEVFDGCVERVQGYLEIIQKHIPLRGGRVENLSILDAACGAGWVAAGIAHHPSVTGCKLHAFDISPHGPELLARYDKSIKSSNKIEASAQDASQMVFDRNTFDVIIGSSILHHFDDYEGFLSHCYSLLNPGGIAIFGEPFAMGYGLGAAALSLAQKSLGKKYKEVDVLYDDLVYRNRRPRKDLEVLVDKHLFLQSKFFSTARKIGYESVEYIALTSMQYLREGLINELEAVSKPPQDDHEASELGEAMEEEGVELVAGNEPSEGLHPTDRALD